MSRKTQKSGNMFITQERQGLNTQVVNFLIQRLLRLLLKKHLDIVLGVGRQTSCASIRLVKDNWLLDRGNSGGNDNNVRVTFM